jgi:protein-tyrosine phosphatase
VIDLHSHILPGLDDGAGDLGESLAMARAAVRDGVETIAATPHVSFDYPVTPAQVSEGVSRLRDALAGAGIPLSVVRGAEIALSRLPELGDAELRELTLGGGPYLLVECPYAPAASLAELVFAVQVRGFRVLLAHPERSPNFQREPERLRSLVERGALCSVNAASLAGRFGRSVRAVAVRLFRDGLVHNVASDSHDAERRPPGTGGALRSAEAELPGISAQAQWLTREVPEAVLAGTDIPPRPAELGDRPRPRWRRGPG